MRSILNPGKVANDYVNEDVSAETETQLLARVASGQQEAFAELYNRLSARLFNYILRLVFDPFIAEELLQETFLSIWKGAKGFKARSKVSTWAFQIAHNLTVSWLRKNANKNKSLTNEALNESILSKEISPETFSLQSAERRELISALYLLPPEQRAVIDLFYVQGLSYKEIATVVSIPLGTVKSRLRMGLIKLRALLRKQSD